MRNFPFSKVSGDPRMEPGPTLSHPGYVGIGCPLQYRVIADPWGSSSHGYGCHANGGHCLPGDRCSDLVERIAVEVSQ